MTITQTPVRTLRERAWCECGGELFLFEQNEDVVNLLLASLTTRKMEFSHRCNKCNQIQLIENKHYPRIVHIDEEKKQ